MSRRRADYEDLNLPTAPLTELPLFGAPSWPQAPTVTEAEQRGLALPASLEDRYAKWRTTDDGTAAYRWMLAESLAQVARGATKLFIDRIAWEYRQKIRRPLNNSYRALMVREMTDAHPVLRGCFEMRTRKAS